MNFCGYALNTCIRWHASASAGVVSAGCRQIAKVMKSNAESSYIQACRKQLNFFHEEQWQQMDVLTCREGFRADHSMRSWWLVKRPVHLVSKTLQVGGACFIVADISSR